MGARQSKRSVDITTTPKKNDGDAVAGEEKIEQLADADVKTAAAATVVTNGNAAHSDIEFADKDEDAKEGEEKAPVEIKENGLTEDGEKTPDKEVASSPVGIIVAEQQQPSVAEEATTVEKAAENAGKNVETPDTKKQKEKKKKKWSLRSISFSKKDKSKPGKEKEKNSETEEAATEERSQEVATTSPISETPKTEESKKLPIDDTILVVTNGDTNKEEQVVAKVPETIPEVEAEKIESAVEVPPKVDEAVSKIEQTDEKIVTNLADLSSSPVEDVVKEVRTAEDVSPPPPLPSTNPPSQVTAFAESTKADALADVGLITNELVTECCKIVVEKTAAVKNVQEQTKMTVPETVAGVVESSKALEESVTETLTATNPISQINVEITESYVVKIEEHDPIVRDCSFTPSLAEESAIEQPVAVSSSKTEESDIAVTTTDSVASAIKANGFVENIPTAIAYGGGDDDLKDVLPDAVPESVEGASIETLPPADRYPVCNAADSLPDLSTESLPSLPEPTDSLLEPMSLPPLDSVPEPLIDDRVVSASSPTHFKKESSLSVIEKHNTAAVLTNGSATNGLKSSPIADDENDDTPPPPSHDGPLKQVASEIANDICENGSIDVLANSQELAPAASE